MSRNTDERPARRPVRAIVGGICFGLGLALLLVNFKVVALGTLAPYLVFAVGVAIGVVVAFVVPPRRPFTHHADR